METRRGFTIIELLLVLVILTCLSSLAVPAMRQSLADANLMARARSTAAAFKRARNEAGATGRPIQGQTLTVADDRGDFVEISVKPLTGQVRLSRIKRKK